MRAKISSLGNKSGFTLIEILIVLVIISILSIAVLVALKPAQRLSDTRDAKRAQDINEILTGVHECVIDKKDGTSMNTCLGSHNVDQTYEIVSGTITSGCQTSCSVATSESSCLQLNTTLSDYFTELPKDPGGVTTGHTRYAITTNSGGMVIIQACAAENGTIKASR